MNLLSGKNCKPGPIAAHFFLSLIAPGLDGTGQEAAPKFPLRRVK